MKLPLLPAITSRDASSPTKNALTTNVVADAQGEVTYAKIRPAAKRKFTFTGGGKGIVSFNGDLISVYGAKMNSLQDGSLTPREVFAEDPGVANVRVAVVSADGLQYVLVETVTDRLTDDYAYVRNEDDEVLHRFGIGNSTIGYATGRLVMGGLLHNDEMFVFGRGTGTTYQSSLIYTVGGTDWPVNTIVWQSSFGAADIFAAGYGQQEGYYLFGGYATVRWWDGMAYQLRKDGNFLWIQKGVNATYQFGATNLNGTNVDYTTKAFAAEATIAAGDGYNYGTGEYFGWVLDYSSFSPVTSGAVAALFGVPGATSLKVWGVSADGFYVYGEVTLAGMLQVFLWTLADGVVLYPFTFVVSPGATIAIDSMFMVEGTPIIQGSATVTVSTSAGSWAGQTASVAYASVFGGEPILIVDDPWYKVFGATADGLLLAVEYRETPSSASRAFLQAAQVPPNITTTLTGDFFDFAQSTL